ncbi:hypothetical protein FGO68_gene17035 [Halteria grandinella]|uniref:Uncharacterized protein n=1 Tax=Halteria grandinella TaxID=5974 RepID=A0A8J8NHI1_HALGN|nr:hypothetical protein FGO68_gene17035 [Halteria grandinella]
MIFSIRYVRSLMILDSEMLKSKPCDTFVLGRFMETEALAYCSLRNLPPCQKKFCYSSSLGQQYLIEYQEVQQIR